MGGSSIKYRWTAIFGKPERIKEVSYIDDYGSWDSSFYRKNGDFIPFKPSPLELHCTKESCVQAERYKKNVLKAIMKVKY